MNEVLRDKTVVQRLSNPYGEPIRAFLADICSLDWRFPFVAPAIQLFVLLFLAVLCGLLYCTIGVASHISNTFWGLIADSQRRMNTNGSAVEKSTYAIATAIFFLLFLPFFVLQLPFWLLWGLGTPGHFRSGELPRRERAVPENRASAARSRHRVFCF